MEGAATKPRSNGLNGGWTEREVEDSIEHGGGGAVRRGDRGRIERGSVKNKRGSGAKERVGGCAVKRAAAQWSAATRAKKGRLRWIDHWRRTPVSIKF